MCEVAEAIEADRNGKYADTDKMKTGMDKIHAVDVYYPDKNYCSAVFFANYNSYIKSSLEEKFADIVIRLLDMAVDLWGKYIFVIPNTRIKPSDKLSFTENAWYFVTNLKPCQPYVNESIVFMYDWAEQLSIDLGQHIEWKMKYNESRPYKHGGKNY